MDVIDEYRTLRKAGQLAEAALLLRRELASLDANSAAKAGTLLQKDLPRAFPSAIRLRVLLLGQCTTQYLIPLLTAWGWVEGLHLEISDGAYDQVIQELQELENSPEVVILLPWHQRLFGGAASRAASERIDDEMAWIQEAWAQIARLKSKLVQISYDWMGAGALGYALSARRGGEIALVKQMNASLMAALPAGAFFVDLQSLSAWQGKAHFYDERNYHWLKQPFAPLGLSILARQTAAGLRSLAHGRRKVLVLDLDNTLWGGVIGEAGPQGIVVGESTEGEAFVAFQKTVKCLKETGILLAVCSKNNLEDAREPFRQNERMVLHLDDFAAFEASWEGKPAGIRRIAQELNLGLDSLVFFDDNPAERAHVRSELPDVLVIEVPPDPAQYVRAVQESLAFEAVDLSAADAERADQYRAESQRRQSQGASTAPGEYLASLSMKAVVIPIDVKNLDRTVDLITKTNQFNLTTRRHSRTAVEEMVAAPGSICFAVRLSDKFGDYGIVSIVLGVAEGEYTLRIDTWLMSCRAMGRTLEHFVMNHLAATAQQAGYERLLAEYLPTAKNQPVAELLPAFGFSPIRDREKYELRLTSFQELPNNIAPMTH